MKFSLFVARRLSLSSGGRKSSPAIKVSVTAVALSVAVMIAAVSIVLGFKREIRDKIIGFNSHISVYAMPTHENEDNVFTLTPSMRELLDNEPFVTDYSLEASIPAILKTPTDFKGIYLRTLNGASTHAFIKRNLEEGKIPEYKVADEGNKIVISRIAADELGLKPGDKIDTYFISDDVRVRRLEVSGIFNSHFDSYDGVIAYGALPLVQKLAGVLPTQGTSLQIQTDDFNKVAEYTEQLNHDLAQAIANGQIYRQYTVDNALNQGAAYFNWLSLLDTNVIVILTLMAIVAIATLISGMLILILDKKSFIGVARAMGASIGQVREVFIYLAMKVAFTGLIIGNILTIAILWAQQHWHFLPLDADAYYIDFVPVQLDAWWILLLNAVCLVLIYIALILPSRFVAGISPTDAMRTE